MFPMSCVECELGAFTSQCVWRMRCRDQVLVRDFLALCNVKRLVQRAFFEMQIHRFHGLPFAFGFVVLSG